MLGEIADQAFELTALPLNHRMLNGLNLHPYDTLEIPKGFMHSTVKLSNKFYTFPKEWPESSHIPVGKFWRPKHAGNLRQSYFH